jgi:hypothetical protein
MMYAVWSLILKLPHEIIQNMHFFHANMLIPLLSGIESSIAIVTNSLSITACPVGKVKEKNEHDTQV